MTARQAVIVVALSSSLSILPSGCSRDPVAPQVEYDAPRARKALVTAVESWKSGEAHKLAKQNPPIRFVDEQFVGGWRLVNYELGPDAMPKQPTDNVSVVLTLKNGKGQELRQTAAYQVGLLPKLSVLRSEP